MRKYQHYITGDDGDYDGYTTNWLAQTFTPEAIHIISKVKLKLFRVGDPGTIIVSIKATSGGKPTGADLCAGTIEGTDITLDTNGEWYEITLGDGYTFGKNIQYTTVVRAPDGDASNKVSWRADKSSPTYTGGTYCSSSDSGVDWGTISGSDCLFEEWGTGEPSPSTIVWGNLLKSQISSEKIEAAIDRIIQAHEDDPNAHVETGESLHSHKAAEIIDHLIESVIEDKLARFSVNLRKLVGNEMMLMCAFETLDGWSPDFDVGGWVNLAIFGIEMATNNSTGAKCWILGESYGEVGVINYSKSPFFQTTVKIKETTSQDIWFYAGNNKWFGFRIVDGTLYATKKGTGNFVATEITGITLTDFNVYRAEYDYSAQKIYYFVNGVLKVTHDTDLPTGTDAFFMFYEIETTTDARRKIFVRDLIWSQKR